MSLPSVRQLEYLVAVAEERHFGRAARRCHVSQPGLSLQVRQLEALMGVTLFERTPRGARPTHAGERAAGRARRVLEELAGLVEEARGAGRPLHGPLRVGIIPTIAPYLLPRLLPALRQEHPELQLSLHEDLTTRLAEELREGRLDLVLAALPVAGAEVEELYLYDEPFDLVVPAGHALAEPGEARTDALERAQVLLLEDGHCLRDQALEVCRSAGAREADELRATSLRTLAQMVVGGFGITLLPRLALAAEVPAGREVAVRRFASPSPKRAVGLAWRRSSPRADEFRLLGEIVRELATEALDSAPRTPSRRRARPASTRASR